MDDDPSTFEQVLEHKRVFLQEASQTKVPANALEAISGRTSSDDLGPWIEEVLNDHSELLRKFTALSSEVEAFKGDIETLRISPISVQEPDDEEEFFELITEACANKALLTRLIERMPSLPLPLSMQEHDKQTAKVLAKVEALTERFEQLKHDHEQCHTKQKRTNAIVPAYNRLRSDFEQEKTTAQVLAKKKREEADEKVRIAEKKLEEAESRADQAEVSAADIHKKMEEAVARAELAEHAAKDAHTKMEQAVGRAEGSEQAAQDARTKMKQAVRRAEGAETIAQDAQTKMERAIRRAEAAQKAAEDVKIKMKQAAHDAAQKEKTLQENLSQSEQEQSAAVYRADTAEHRVRELEARLADLDETAKAAKLRVGEIESDCIQAKEQRTRFEEKSESSERQVNELKTTNATLSTEIGDLKREISEIEQKRTTLSDTASQQKEAISRLERQERKLSLEVTELKSSEVKLQSKLSTTQTRWVSEKQDNATLREQFEDDEHIVGTIRADLHRSESELAAVQLAQIASLHRVSRLRQILTQQKSRNNRLKDRIMNLQADNAAVQLAGGNLVNRVEDLATRIEGKTHMIRRAHHCVIRLRGKITDLRDELASYKQALESYQRTSDIADLKAQSILASLTSWQTVFFSLLGDVPPDWEAFQRVIAISEEMIDIPVCLTGEEWFEITSCLAGPRSTVDILQMLRCFLRKSLSFKEVRAIAESMIECNPSTRRIILSAMFAYLERETGEYSVAEAVAIITMQDLLHRYLLGTALGRRVRTNLAINEAKQKSPLVAGLAEWSCTGKSFVETVSDESTRLGLSLVKDNTKLIADENRLLKITADGKLLILWPGEFEIVYATCLQIKVGDEIQFSWDILTADSDHIDILNHLSDSVIGPVVKGF